MKKTKFIYFGLLFIAGGLLLANSVSAEALIEATSASCSANGNCQLSDVMKVVIWVTKWILGIVGSLSLLMFVYGGLTFLISGGSSNQVEKGKKIITGAVIGLILVFTSYTIINFSLQSLGYQNPLSGSNWSSIQDR